MLDALVAIEEALTITEPVEMSVKRSIDTLPNSNQPLVDGDLPAWLHEWDMPDGEWLAGGAREMNYTIHSILLVGDTNTELNQRMRIATKFWEALVTALQANDNLGDGDLYLNRLRAHQGRMEFFGRAYVGLEVWLEIQGIGTSV